MEAKMNQKISELSQMPVGSTTAFNDLGSVRSRQEFARKVAKHFGVTMFQVHIRADDVKVTRMHQDAQMNSDEEDLDEEVDQLCRFELGFSMVIQQIILSKKPIVGHNMFLDMLFIYD
jgi:hypothetical protein